MGIVTRFNPTNNGPLHLGHVYSLLVNERITHASPGGRFLVRFDDSFWLYQERNAARAAAIAGEQRQDISWLGIDVDGWYSQLDMLPQARELLTGQGYILERDPEFPPVPQFVGQPPTWIAYPYTRAETPERVVMDYMLGVNLLLRGEELATEYAFYCHWCDVLRFPRPTFVYLPRLQSARGDISKTNGGYTVAELRGQGYMAADILELVTRAALKHPGNGWSLSNLQPAPRLAL